MDEAKINNRSSQRAVVLVACAFGAFVIGLVACASQELPEPESEDARLYVQYCAGSGCHDPIPPQGSSVGYWNQQFRRMLVLMVKSGSPMPNEAEQERILDYLRRNARGAPRRAP